MKTTANLEKDLKAYNSLRQFFQRNRNNMSSGDLAAQVQQLISAKGLTRAQVVKDSNLNDVYAYQIISGVRRPSRDKLICLCIGMKATLDETQNLLRRNGFPPLYARVPRDSIIIFALNHGQSVLALNENLYDYNEELL